MLDTLPQNTIVRANYIFFALRKEGRAPRGTSPVFHAVTPHYRMALCADEPGARSGWAEPPAEHVTCILCLRRLAQLSRFEVELPRSRLHPL